MPDALALLKTGFADRYAIERELGRGGMATVYLAQDLKHPRQVAIKVLRSEVVGALGADRFLKEIEVVSRLQHPHILGLLDSGTAGDVLYYVMPYIDGESLRHRLARESQLPVDQAIALAREMADALQYAHDRGIVHRDIKPENILLSGGHALVADFGIAKALDAAAGDKLTETGLSLGTPHYMSPEQASATASLDGRADLYALGCVLYEMLAGTPPFTGPSAQAILARHSVDPVPSLHTLRGTVPVGIEWAITKAMAKVPADRFATAADFATALAHPERAPVRRGMSRRLSYAGVAIAVLALAAGIGGRSLLDRIAARVPQVRSLAVLPVENLTGDSSLVYLSDGMTDQFITDLGQIQALRVISRISVLGFAGSRESPQQIAGKLHVDALLAGSLQQAKDSVHVSLQLISARDGHALWTQSFDAPVQDARRLQLDVARTVAERIGVDLTPAERARLGSSARTIDPAAFAAYLKGRYHQNTSDFQAADSFFSAALDIDPTYAPAYAGRAEIYNQRGYSGELIPADAFPVAKANAARAIEADSTNAEAHAALAYAVMYYDWDWATAEREYRKAITLNPNSATAHNWYSLFLLAMGRFDEAELEGRRAIQLDPLSVAIAREYGWIAHYSGRQDSAVARVQRALALNEKDKVAHLFLGRAYQAQGRYPEAMREYQATGPLLHWPVTVASAGYVAAKEGDREGVARAFAELDSLATAPRTYVAPLLNALIYAALGDKDRAFALLNQSVEQRVHWLFWLNRDPRWGPLRSDPRFQALARRVGLPR
jgi:serine/threonine-protein kinase